MQTIVRTHEFSDFVGHHISPQSNAFLYTSDAIIWVDFTNEVKNLNTENHQVLSK